MQVGLTHARQRLSPARSTTCAESTTICCANPYGVAPLSTSVSVSIASAIDGSAFSAASAPSAMISAARWKSNRLTRDEPRADQHVRRIAGEPRARDAVLQHLEGVDHHGRQAGTVRRAEELALDETLGAPAQPAAAP